VTVTLVPPEYEDPEEEYPEEEYYPEGENRNSQIRRVRRDRKLRAGGW
jgi:hypothetical protein